MTNSVGVVTETPDGDNVTVVVGDGDPIALVDGELIDIDAERTLMRLSSSPSWPVITCDAALLLLRAWPERTGIWQTLDWYKPLALYDMTLDEQSDGKVESPEHAAHEVASLILEEVFLGCREDGDHETADEAEAVFHRLRKKASPRA